MLFRSRVSRPRLFGCRSRRLDGIGRTGADPSTLGGGRSEKETIGDERLVAVPAGRYNLMFEARSSSDADVAYDLHLQFPETSTPSFAILKQGDGIETDPGLSTVADPA
jgi:hypothetical protein